MAVTSDQIQGLYIAYFNRPADFFGLQFWTDAANNGGGVAAVANAFSSSPEYTQAYAGKTTAQIIDQIYVNLFGRHAELDGIKFWGNALNSGILNIGNIAYQIMTGAQDTDGGFQDKTAVANKISAATAFYNALDTGIEVAAYSGDAANALVKTWLAGVTDQASLDAAISEDGLNQITKQVVDQANPPPTPKVFTLTTGIDNLVGTSADDIFNAAPGVGGDSFTALDNLDGGAGNDTLNIVLSGTTGNLAAGATVKNIETVNLTSGGIIGSGDISTFQGVTTLNVVAAGAIGGVKASATTDINVANGVDAVTLNGGKNVVVNTTAATAGVSVGGTTAAAGNITVTNAGTGTVSVKGAGTESVTSGGGALTFINGTTITAVASTAVSAATVKAHNDAAAAALSANNAAVNTVVGGLVTTYGSDASGAAADAAVAKVGALGTLATAIAAATKVSANQSTALSIQLATTNAVAAGAITAADKVSIDAAFSVGLATNTAAARTAAQAILTPLQTAATAAQNAAIAADATHDATVAAANTAAIAVVTADTANLNAAKNVTVTATTNTALTSVSVKGNAGTATVQVGTGAAFQNTIKDGSALSNTLTTVTLENTGNSELIGQAIATVNATGMSGNVSITNSTLGHTQTFNLSGITAGTYADAGATTVKINGTGTATNSLTALNAAAATSVVITGAAGFKATTLSVDAAAVIDASGSSGTNTLTLLNGQAYKGGSGNDIISSTGASTVTVDGGAGAADVLKLSGFDATKAAKYANFEVLNLSNAVTSVDVSKFTNSAFTSEVVNGGTLALTGLTAAQAAAITVAASGTYTFGVTGATTVGQLDTVSLTIDDGSSAPSTITLTGPTLAGVETLNLTAKDSVTIDSLVNATALTKIVATGAGDVSITSGALNLNVNSTVDVSGSTGDSTVDFSLAGVNGVAIKAGDGDNTLKGTDILGKGNSIVTGNGNNTITSGQADDSITAGNGNNTIHAGAGANTITVGNGNNTIDNIASTTVVTVTAGNGNNVIAGGAGADIIKVGTGSNLVTGGAGADVITFGAHAAGVIDGLVYAALNAVANDSGAALTGNASAASLDVITGLHKGDTINLGAAAGTLTVGLAGAYSGITAGTAAAEIVRGSYDTTTHNFVASATGADSLVQWADGTAGHGSAGIVLVGYAGVAAGNILDGSGVLTLG